ncbi:putative copper-importing P-type ATPase A [bacterium BMS3Bbin10]|nr:putative copper-importing P-type ATPase A [bacterium BMS3Bbin10]
MSVEAAIPQPHGADSAGDTCREERTLSLVVENMNCGGCLRSVEKAVSAVPGVAHARANLSAKRIMLRFDPEQCAEDTLVEALAGAGFRAAVMEAGKDADADLAERRYLRRVAIAGFAAANIMLLSLSVWWGNASDMDEVTQALFHRLSALIALPVVAYAGQPFFSSAISALKARRLNMDVPISLAVILATAMSVFQTLNGSQQVYFDAAVTLLFFLLIGRWLDQRLRTRAHGEAQNLLSLQSGFATVISAGGKQRNIPAYALTPGDKVLISAGERVPADGVLLSGRGQIDQSLITGESDPAWIDRGDAIHAGTLNLGQPITLEVTAADEMTLLAEIGRLMANAEQGRTSYRKLADRMARIYAPAVHLLGAVTFITWLLLGAGWETALTYAIAVLIITCPCALALAVPAVQIAAASRLFRNGVILKNADALERLAEIDTIVFDKTGTLTLGHPSLINGDEISGKTLAAAAALGTASRHPYAKAVVEAARARFGEVDAGTDVEERPGEGLRRIAPGGEERLGAPSWCGARDTGDASLCYRSPEGKITPFQLRDTLRPDAFETIRQLKALGFKVSLLSGDRNGAVEEAAAAAGIEEWRGEANPAEKIAVLQRLGRGGKTLMVGDGLNDAPALAQAHISISPAKAVDITQRSADLVFQGNNLAPVLDAIRIAARARNMAFQNFAIALAYNTVCVPLAMSGYVTPLVAAIAMSTSSILVTVNALRLGAVRAGEGT